MGWEIARREHYKREYYLPLAKFTMVDPLVFGVGLLALELYKGNMGMEGFFFFLLSVQC